MDKIGEFNGFSKQTLTFLKNLKKNNDKDWFEAHRRDYDEYFVQPAQELVMALGPRLAKLSKGVGFDPNHTGRGSVKKIFFDQRFVKDRPPFKTWLDVIFWEGPLKAKKDNSVFFFRLLPDLLVIGAGIKGFTPETQKAYRAAVDDNQRGAALSKVLKPLMKLDGYHLGGAHYKQVPKGFDPDHPRGELLKHTGIHVWFETKVPDEVFSAGLIDYAYEHYQRLAPLHKWCVDLLEGM
ncbi:DUF2461 domain-containing protein [bacterium]|nr:DUF2461 domain-containing protein [bacterium]